MTNFIVKIFVTALALLLTTYILPGIEITSFTVALIAALFLGILNAIVRPLLIILTLPITILTLGIFIFVINAGIFFTVASFVDGFQIDGFITALLGSILVSIISTVITKILD